VKVRFLLDENLPPRLKPLILKYSEQIDVVRVGEAGAPGMGTQDPDILTYLEVACRLLVTNSRKSMPGHVLDHYATGGHHWGIATIRPNVGLGKLVEEIALIWVASEAEAWSDREDWLPL